MTRTAIALAALLLGSAPAQAQVIDLTTSTPEAKSVTPPKLIANADVSAQADTGDQQGVVILTYDVGTDGKVTEVRLARAADSPLLNDVAVASALGRRYAPATRGGAPVAVRIATLIRFGAASAPADAPAPDQQTELDCNHGTHHIAIAACTALIDNPDGRPLDSLLLARARAYEMVGQYREAIADYDRLIAINDKAAAFYRARGFLHERLNQPELAVADYNLALERNPTDQLTHFDRGAAELALRRASDARTDMKWTGQCPRPRRVLEIDTSGFADSGGHTASGLGIDPAGHSWGSSGGSGFRPRSRGPCTPPEEFTQPPELATLSMGSPDAPRLYALRCELRAVEGKDLDGALSDCNTALIFDARSARALTGRAVVYYRKDEPEAAMKDVQAALAINDPLSGALFLRGVLRAQAGDDASAYADFLAARTTTRDVAEDFTTFGIAP